MSFFFFCILPDTYRPFLQNIKFKKGAKKKKRTNSNNSIDFAPFLNAAHAAMAVLLLLLFANNRRAKKKAKITRRRRRRGVFCNYRVLFVLIF